MRQETARAFDAVTAIVHTGSPATDGMTVNVSVSIRMDGVRMDGVRMRGIVGREGRLTGLRQGDHASALHAVARWQALARQAVRSDDGPNSETDPGLTRTTAAHAVTA